MDEPKRIYYFKYDASREAIEKIYNVDEMNPSKDSWQKFYQDVAKVCKQEGLQWFQKSGFVSTEPITQEEFSFRLGNICDRMPWFGKCLTAMHGGAAKDFVRLASPDMDASSVIQDICDDRDTFVRFHSNESRHWYCMYSFADLSDYPGASYNKFFESLEKNGFLHSQHGAFVSAEAMSSTEMMFRLKSVCVECPWIGKALNSMYMADSDLSLDNEDLLNQVLDNTNQSEALRKAGTPFFKIQNDLLSSLWYEKGHFVSLLAHEDGTYSKCDLGKSPDGIYFAINNLPEDVLDGQESMYFPSTQISREEYDRISNANVETLNYLLADEKKSSILDFGTDRRSVFRYAHSIVTDVKEQERYVKDMSLLPVNLVLQRMSYMETRFAFDISTWMDDTYQYPSPLERRGKDLIPDGSVDFTVVASDVRFPNTVPEYLHNMASYNVMMEAYFSYEKRNSSQTMDYYGPRPNKDVNPLILNQVSFNIPKILDSEQVKDVVERFTETAFVNHGRPVQYWVLQDPKEEEDYKVVVMVPTAVIKEYNKLTRPCQGEFTFYVDEQGNRVDKSKAAQVRNKNLVSDEKYRKITTIDGIDRTKYELVLNEMLVDTVNMVSMENSLKNEAGKPLLAIRHHDEKFFKSFVHGLRSKDENFRDREQAEVLNMFHKERIDTHTYHR